MFMKLVLSETDGGYRLKLHDVLLCSCSCGADPGFEDWEADWADCPGWGDGAAARSSSSVV